VIRLIVTANVPSSLILFTLMKALRSSETSVLTRASQRHIQEDGIVRSHRRENFKSYIALIGWALQRRRIVSLVKYKLVFHISEAGIMHSHRRENLKSCHSDSHTVGTG
jgi:hypothetical protein